MLSVVRVMDPQVLGYELSNPPMMAKLEVHESHNLPSRIHHTAPILRYPHESGTILSSCFET